MKSKIYSVILFTCSLFFSTLYGQNTYNETNYSFRQFITSSGNYQVVTSQEYDKINMYLTYLDEVNEISDFTYSSVFSISLYFCDPKAKSESDLTTDIKMRYKSFPYKIKVDSLGRMKKSKFSHDCEIITYNVDNETYKIEKRNFYDEQLQHEMERKYSIRYRRYLLKKGDEIMDTLYCSVPYDNFQPVFFTVSKKDQTETLKLEAEWNNIVKIIERPDIINSINQKYGDRLLKEIFVDGDIYIYKVFFNAKPLVQNSKDVSYIIEQFIFSNKSPEQITSEILLKNVNFTHETCKITYTNYEFLKKVNLIDFYRTVSQEFIELYGVDYNKFIDLNLLNEPYNALKKNTNVNLAEYSAKYFLARFDKDSSFLTKEKFFITYKGDEIEIDNNKYPNNSYMPFGSKSFTSDQEIYTSNLDFNRFNYNPWQTFSESLPDIQHNLSNRFEDRVLEMKGELVAEQTNAANEQKAIKQLETKYGKKFVDAAMKGNIIVGMHEDLLEFPLQLWTFDRKTTGNSTQTYYFHSKIDSSTKMSVSISNKKVTNVYTW
jgi:hypothetical protein